MMNFLRTKFLPTLTSILMACPAVAVIDTDLIAARDAYKRNDVATLNNIAGQVPSDELLAMYPKYLAALKALDQENDFSTRSFLSNYNDTVLGERLRNEWLKRLGKRGDWTTFTNEWKRLPKEGSDQESRCYADTLALQQGNTITVPGDWLDSRTLPEGCNRFITAATQRGVISQQWVTQRIRYLLAGNYTTAARQLASSTGIPLDLNSSSGEGALYNAIRGAKDNLNGAAAKLSAAEAMLTPEQAAFGWGQLALRAAKQLNMAQALQWYNRAGNNLSNEQWEWWGRAALRTGQWSQVESITAKMPPSLQDYRTWQYWRARALSVQGRQSEATVLYRKVSVTGRNFYALLAMEELGDSVHSSRNTTDKPSTADIRRISTEPAIQRALALHQLSVNTNRPEWRDDARREWRWAMRERSDKELLAAAELGAQYNFIEMSIYSADMTEDDHDFALRYPTPHRDLMHRYSLQNGLDEAWAYGLIRQESRFVPVARSGVGASGLMQIMPSTAKWIAGKLGESNYSINDLDTNIRYGTWYLQHINNQLGDEVLATAGYNAGPGRARAWRDYRSLEGAIYAETIPFNETRDYVQKVMANATYYAYTFGERNLSLKRRMGTVPAK